MARPMPSPLRRIADRIRTSLHPPIRRIIPDESSRHPPEYRRVIEAALKSYDKAAAEEALNAYRHNPLLRVHRSHYPIIHQALRIYQQRESSADVEAVIEQVEYVMTGRRRSL